MYRPMFDPIWDCWDLFRKFSSMGCSAGRRFWTRKERIEELERLKAQLQREITGINEMIEDLKAQEAKASSA
jgi:hypothetical protein